MNTHSSTVQALNPGAQKPLHNARGSATGQQSGDTSFAKHLDVDHVPPAQAARAALENRSDLADRPFGAIVSLFARHEELPAPADVPPAEPTPTEPAPSEETAVDVEGEDTSSVASA